MRRLNSAIIAFLLLGSGTLWAQPVAAQIASPGAEELAELDQWIEGFMRENNVPGGMVGVFSRGRAIRIQPYGYANAELRVPVTDSTVFEIGSISKQFVAAATMLLVEEGRMGLADPIHSYLPFLPGEWTGVTVRQLMTHTSGIPDYELIRSYDVYRFRMTPQDVVSIANGRPMDFEPGQGWFYSNTGYYLLSLIVEKVDGKPIGKVLHDRIFAPLGMNQTRMADPEVIIPNRAAGYWINAAGDLINRAPTETSSTLAAGGLLSSVRDLAIWDEALYSDRLLSDEIREAMWAPTILPDGENTGYGFGFAVGEYLGRPYIGHSGQVAGFVARFLRFPDREALIVVFLNRYQASSRAVANRVVELYLPQ